MRVFNLEVIDAAYPREGTETFHRKTLPSASTMQLIPARGRKHGLMSYFVSPRRDAAYPREGTENRKQRKGVVRLHEQTLAATLGGLLQNTGGLLTSGGTQNTGAEFLRGLWPDCPQLRDCLGGTDAAALQGLPGNSPAYPVYAAGRLTSDPDGGKASFDRAPLLRPIFTHMNGEHPGFVIPPALQDGAPFRPVPEQSARSGGYDAIAERLRAGLSQPGRGVPAVNRLLCMLETCLSRVPSATSDISLYDSAKVTAAVAACISEYLLAQGETDWKGRLLTRESAFRQEQVFLLYSADFSGIQKFIFTVSTDGALASLRSRSFFLSLLMEHYIDELLTACSLSRANLLYSGGGHCYLLLPNTEKCQQALQQWNQRMNQFLLEQFGAELFIAHGWTPCSGSDLTNTPAEAEPYTAMFRRVSRSIARHKLCRYTPEQLRSLNRTEASETGRECRVCGRSDALTPEGRCRWCQRFVNLSQKILLRDVYLVSSEDTGSDFSLPGFAGDTYFTMTDSSAAQSRVEKGEAVIRVYTKNRADPELPNGIRLYVGDYAASSSMEQLCADSKGIARLAVCRMDVDNLGQAFVSGFRSRTEQLPAKRDRYLTLARTAAFSRQMSLFFQCHINGILRRPRPDGTGLAVTVVYSGGDDVFLVGAWDSVLEAAQRIRQEFRAFSCGSLTISAGISLHKPHFPIRQAADRSAELEDLAKALPGKDAVALFSEDADCAYHWQEFEERVLAEKKALLDDFFREENQERGNAFLYRLLDFLRNARQEKLNLARLAYLLSRMEPRERDRQAQYRTFSEKFYGWSLSEADRRQLITAIYLHVYAERKQVQ